MTVHKEEITKTVSETVRIDCNLCGAVILNSGCGFEFARLSAHWGYESTHDGDTFTLDFCEKCIYDKILPMLKIQPDIQFSL